MAIDFPNSPTNGQIFTVGDKSWIWDGTVWKAYGASLSPTVLKVDSTNSRVGINNQSPAYALDVTGTANATVFLQNATDYLSPFNGFRNAIINGDFRINQRAWSSSTTDGTYGFDRWAQSNSGGTVTMSTQPFSTGASPTPTPVTGYVLTNYLRMVTLNNTGTSSYAGFYQHIEDVRTFAGQPITISFYARSGSGTPKVSAEMTQFFGSGGLPSGFVQTAISAVTISTTWTRYTMSFTPASVSSKTIGTTANTSSLRLFFFVSAGSSLATVASSIGNQDNTFDFWGIQVERGSYATPFEQRPIQTELALCQRYYEKSYRLATAPGTAESNGMVEHYGSLNVFGVIVSMVKFLVPKRYTGYTITAYNTDFSNTNTWYYGTSGGSYTATAAPTIDLPAENSFRAYIGTGGSGGATGLMKGQWVCNSEF